MRLLSDFVQ